jgi:hypothetical protein
MSTQKIMANLQIDQMESQIEALKRRLAESEATINKLTSERDVSLAARKLAISAASAGVMPGAIPDAVNRALNAGTWRQDDKGRLVLFAEDGFPAHDGAYDAMTVDSFVKSLRHEVPYLWPASESAAADKGADSKPAAADPENPWSKEYFNLTRQAAVWVRDPARAEKLAAAAGVPVIPRLAGQI